MAKNADILKNMPLVYLSARQLASRLPPNVDIQDLISCGVFGLMEALDGFDPTLKVKFKTYANYRIRGAMLDYLRKEDVTPRSIRKKAAKIKKATDEFYSKFKRIPDDDELAQSLNMSKETYLKLKNESQVFDSIGIIDINPEFDDTATVENKTVTSDDICPIELIHRKECRDKIIKTIEGFTVLQRTVVSLVFFEGMTKSDVARLLGITGGYVSQIISGALIKLRRAISF